LQNKYGSKEAEVIEGLRIITIMESKDYSLVVPRK